MNSLPNELILEISSKLNGRSLQAFHQTCCRFKNLTPKISETKYQTDINASNNIIKFRQEEINYFLIRVDALENENHPGVARQIGSRVLGDRTVQSRLPIASFNIGNGLMSSYFEVEIINVDEARPGFRIGLSLEELDYRRPLGSLVDSIGYCGDDGNVSIGNIYDDKFQFGPPFGLGDVVGCGYDPFQNNGLIFFTLNGEWIGDAPYKVTEDICDYKKRWHASFSSSVPADIKMNTDGPFLYQNIVDSGDKYEVEKEIEFSVRRTKGIHQAVVTYSPTVISFPWNILYGTCIQSNSSFSDEFYPITKHGYYYYEVKVLQKPFGNTFLSVGLAPKPYPTKHHIGWNLNSIGYHRYLYFLYSDDGLLFQDSYGSDKTIGVGFGLDSTVGCGYSPYLKQVIFTQEGKLLTKIKVDIAVPLHISMAATSNWIISVNVGKDPFMYSFGKEAFQ
jgi:hypothetical protein